MPPTVADILPRLAAVCVSGATHADYNLTVQRATLYRKLATGDIGTLLQQFSRREDEAQFETRKQMTIETVSAAWNQLRTPFYEVARKRGGDVTKRFDYAKTVPVAEAQRRQQRLAQAVDHYYNGQPIENFLAQKVVRSQMMSDPGAWLLTEFLPFDANTQVAQPYPVLVPCEAAVDMTYQAGTVASFTVRLAIPQDPTRYRFCCYLANVVVDCWPVLWDNDEALHTMPEDSLVKGQQFVDGNDRVQYDYRVLVHKAGVVPALPLGYVEDEAGTGASFVSPLHAALPFLIGMLKVGSENDIVMAQMAFPVRARYAKDCPGVGRDELGNIHQCINGLDNVTLKRCVLCGGTGELGSTITAAETITIPAPKPGDQGPTVKPSEAMAFIGPPTDNPKLQLDYLQSRRLLAMQAVHGVEDADRVAGSQTATQRRLRQKAQQVALAPFADQLSSLYKNAGYASAGYTDTAADLSIVYLIDVIDADSQDELYERRKSAVDAGVDASTLEAIDNAIAYRQYADDPDALQKNQVKRRFMTFLGYSDAQVLGLATLGYISPYDRVARTHADIIFGELEVEAAALGTDFYQLAYEAQAQQVDAKIKEILAKLPTTTPAASSFRPLSLPTATQDAQAVA